MITRELFIRYMLGKVSVAELNLMPEEEHRGLAFLKSAAKLTDALIEHGFRSTAMRLSDIIISGDVKRTESILLHCVRVFTNLDCTIGSHRKPYYDAALSYACAAHRMFTYLISFYDLP